MLSDIIFLNEIKHTHPSDLLQTNNTYTLTGELVCFPGDLQAHAAGAAAVEAAQFEGASVSWRVRGKNHRGPSAPPWDDLQQPRAA